MSFRILGRTARVSYLHGLCGFALAATGVLGVASLAACGQKGPLFMPPPPRIPATGQTAGAPATPASAPAATSALPAPPPASGPVMLPPR
ncbi:MAG: lipoprotein [Polaromonas sp.]|nr:lipoprotein [Polaromonas sp.]